MAIMSIRTSTSHRPIDWHRVCGACWSFVLAVAVFAVVGLRIVLDLPWLDQDGFRPAERQS
jgi:hypothetical protein